tara:strand:+ start:16429 stop:17625 length:1197 start_codon:yes stop_codon:yes gene_type:complete
MRVISASSLPSGSLGVSFTKAGPTTYAEDFLNLGDWLIENQIRGPLNQREIEQNALGKDTHGKTMRVSLSTFGWSTAGDRGRSEKHIPVFELDKYLTSSGWEMYLALGESQKDRVIELVRNAYLDLNERCLGTIFSSDDEKLIQRARSQLMIIETLRFLSRYDEISKQEAYVIYHVLKDFDMLSRSRVEFDEEVDNMIHELHQGDVEIQGTPLPPWPTYILGCHEWTGFAKNKGKQSHLIRNYEKEIELKEFVRALGEWDGKPLIQIEKEDIVERALIENLEEDDGSGFVYAIVNPVWPNWVKIGMSVDWVARLKSYQTGDPYRSYRLLGVSRRVEGREDAEAFMHKITQAHHLCEKRENEWFMVPEEVIHETLNQVDKNFGGEFPEDLGDEFLNSLG